MIIKLRMVALTCMSWYVSQLLLGEHVLRQDFKNFEQELAVSGFLLSCCKSRVGGHLYNEFIQFEF